MLYSNQLRVCLRNVQTSTPFAETLNENVVSLDGFGGRAHSSLICEDAGIQYDVSITITRYFDLQGADGLMLAVFEGNAQTDDHSMKDTQKLYLPRHSSGNVEGKYVVATFRKWSTSGRDTLQDLKIPQPNGTVPRISLHPQLNADTPLIADHTPGGEPYSLRPCLNGHQGAITVTLQRVKFQRSSTNYIIRRSNTEHDMSTVPPECHR
ncbi:hypothetical protein B0A55_02781 [Friedmanniomyces simplex]|uniref:Uncharacterized protein n=1 Tax=Friedmanniomyces simplex TaxID=329884 RepID=A0A4U0XT59_9PEZI|nr:hypothetical protein B0A55_02781 [Friedmanniomyces simplex]